MIFTTKTSYFNNLPKLLRTCHGGRKREREYKNTVNCKDYVSSVGDEITVWNLHGRIATGEC
jgi:hypothetical protein